MQKPKHLKALLVDMDGTLADSAAFLFNAYDMFLRDFNLKGTKEEFLTLIGPSLNDIVALLKEKYQLPGSTQYLAAMYHQRLEQRYTYPIALFPGSRECLAFAKQQGLQCILVTSASHRLAKSFLEIQGLDRIFDCLITGDMVARSKPDPAIYLLALSKGYLTAAEAIAIEDSVSGISAAVKAHISTFWLFGEPDYLDSGDEVKIMPIQGWYDILALLRSWYE